MANLGKGACRRPNKGPCPTTSILPIHALLAMRKDQNIPHSSHLLLRMHDRRRRKLSSQSKPSDPTIAPACLPSSTSISRYHPCLPSFLYSKSLGGAIALIITLCQPRLRRPFDGLILNNAMCGISAKFKPPCPLEHLLFLVAAAIPTWRVVPTCESISEVSFKEEWKRKLAVVSPRRSMARSRAATALELMRVCKQLQGEGMVALGVETEEAGSCEGIVVASVSE